jgi:hypothetical protein
MTLARAMVGSVMVAAAAFATGCAGQAAEEYVATPLPEIPQISAPTIIVVNPPSFGSAPAAAMAAAPAPRKVLTDGTYSLRNVRSKQCLDVPRRSKDARTLLWQWECNSTDAQSWSIMRQPDGAFLVASKSSGKCLEVPGTAKTTNINLWQNDCDDSSAQTWKLEVGDDGTYLIRSVGSGECVDVPHGEALKGIGVQEYTCYGGEPQRWILTRISD